MNIQWNLCDMIPNQIRAKEKRLKELQDKGDSTTSDEHHEKMKLKRELEEGRQLRA